jgi:hypothetical protein
MEQALEDEKGTGVFCRQAAITVKDPRPLFSTDTLLQRLVENWKVENDTRIFPISIFLSPIFLSSILVSKNYMRRLSRQPSLTGCH